MLVTATNRLILFALSILLIFLARDINTLMIVAGVWVFPLAILTKSTRKTAVFLVALVLPTFVMLVVIYGILVPNPSQERINFDLVSLSRSGVAQSVFIALRLILLGSIVHSLLLSVSPSEIAKGLKTLGVPKVFTMLFVASIVLFPAVIAKTRMIIDAQRSRGIFHARRNPLKRVVLFTAILRPLLFSLLQESLDRACLWESTGMLAPSLVERFHLQSMDFVVLAYLAAIFGLVFVLT
jgi:energy-coupling factor transporter transmembrane protein EcfT